PVPADGLLARRARRGAVVAALETAGVAAAVTGVGVAVVALLPAPHQPVAALRLAADALCRAGPPGLERAVGSATVARGLVPVVALLAARHAPVAAGQRGDALVPGHRAREVGLHRAVRRAAVAGGSVPVVAALAVTGVDDAVAALRGRA